MVAYMNDEPGKRISEIDNLLKKSKKKSFITMACIFVVILVATILVLNNGKINVSKDKVKVTDITITNNKMNMNANRKFMVYDKDPTVEYDETEQPAKAIREIDVVFEGTANYDEGKFEGIIKVDENELQGDIVGYSSGIVESDYKEPKFMYSITAMCANNDGTSPDGATSYDINISKDLSEILIYVYRFNEDNPLIIYSKVE